MTTANYTTLLVLIDENQQRHRSRSWVGRVNFVKKSVLSILISYQSNPNENPKKTVGYTLTNVFGKIKAKNGQDTLTKKERHRKRHYEEPLGQGGLP